MDELFLVINNDIIGYRITCLQIMEYFEASFIFLTDSMVSFFSSHWISWTSCHFWTIFLIIGAIRFLLHHFSPNHHVGFEFAI